MNQRTLFLRVGGLLVFSAALLIGLVLLLTGDSWHKGQLYETYFRESVEGLDVGAPVKYRGVTMGHISHIGLVSAEYGATPAEQATDPSYQLIVVRFKVDPRRIGKSPDTDTLVKSGLRAKLANQGLTGVMFLELDFLPPDQFPPRAVPWTPDADYIPSVPSTFAQVQDMVTQVLNHLNKADINGLIRNLDGLIGDLRHDVNGGDVHAALLQVRDSIADVQSRIDAADLPALTAKLRQTSDAITQLAQGAPTRDAVAQARVALARLAKLLDSLTQAANQANAGVTDAEAELIPILRDVRATAANLREATETIRRDPGSLLLQGAPPKDRER